MNCCPTPDKVRYEVSFYFVNPETPEVNPIELVRYNMDTPFPEFRKGDKFYISQGSIHPATEKSIILNNKTGEVIFPDNMIQEMIEEYKKFASEHHIHKVKIVKVYKSLSNEWDTKGKSTLIYNVEYKLKECFYFSYRLFVNKIKSIWQ